MNLREAQLLGILALIAVGIILLCMWGGEVKDTPTAGGTGVQQYDAVEPSISELCDQVRVQQEEPPPADETEESVMLVGGPPADEFPGPDEETTIWDWIHDTMPEEIAMRQEPEPTAPPLPKPEPVAPRTVTHTVARGETLSSISKKYYGTPAKWRVIQEANRDVVPDPKLLRPGMKLKIPKVGATSLSGAEVAQTPVERPVLSSNSTDERKTSRTYAVKKGDTLYDIALRVYGDGSRWKEILAANRTVHGLQDPQDVRPGMMLVVP